VIAHLLAGEGFDKIEDISIISMEELSSIEGFDENLAYELQKRSYNYIKEEIERSQTICKSLDVSESLTSLKGITWKMAAVLGKNSIKDINDLANLSGEELIEILGKISISKKNANEIIMIAREHWFEK
jgi:N utilization substance protein A